MTPKTWKHQAATWIKSPSARVAAQKGVAAYQAVKELKKLRNQSNSKRQFKLKRRRNASRINSRGLTGETTTVTITNKPPKKSAYNIIKKIGNEDQYLTDQTNALVCAAGRQQPATFSIMPSNVDVIDAISQTGRFYNYGTGGIIQVGPVANGFRSNKTLIKSAYLTLQLTSQTPAVTNMMIYTLMAKNTTSSTLVYPETDWAQGLSQEGGQADPLYIGSRPTASKQFNMNWKVKARHQIQLMGGQQHMHKVQFNINRYIDNEYFANYTTIRGVTLAIMIVLWGQPGDLANTSANAGTSVTTTPCKIVGIQNVTYKYQLLDIFPKQIYHKLTGIVQDPQSHVYIINEEAGNVVDVQDATGNTSYA